MAHPQIVTGSARRLALPATWPPPLRPGSSTGPASARCSTGSWQSAREGQGAVLVMRGEAGIGKTALLRYAARQASGFRVAQVAGVEAEMELPFSGIHQLCAPVLDQARRAPAAPAETR